MDNRSKKLISDNPSTAEIKNLLPLVKTASFVTGIFSHLGSQKAKKLKDSVDRVLEQTDILEIPDRFNSAFRKEGWIATGSFSMDTMRNALQLHEEGKADEAEQAIIEWFTQDNLDLFCVQRSRRFHKADLRTEQLREALKLFLEERYFAAVPLILIACDGLASDVVGYSPFKVGADLSCFDSVVGHESSLPALIGQLITGIKKSSNTELLLPHRNGILHGRSLGYANKRLCAKAWLLYLALVDWAADKESEQARIEAHENKQKITWRDTMKTIEKNRRTREAIGAFVKTEKKPPFLELEDTDMPEHSFDAFFGSWQRKNFGEMAKHAMNQRGSSLGKLAGEMREMDSLIAIHSYQIELVRQTTVARAEAIIHVKAANIWNEELIGTIEVLAFRCADSGKTVLPDEDGRWRVQQNCVYKIMQKDFVDSDSPEV